MKTTVSDLIGMLGVLPPDAEVYLEGCDCINKATWAVDEKDGTVLIGADVSSTTVEEPSKEEKNGRN